MRRGGRGCYLREGYQLLGCYQVTNTRHFRRAWASPNSQAAKDPGTHQEGAGSGGYAGVQSGWKGLSTQPATTARRLGRCTARKPKGRSKSTLT